jgi:hypothetical protein
MGAYRHSEVIGKVIQNSYFVKLTKGPMRRVAEYISFLYKKHLKCQENNSMFHKKNEN